MVITMTSNTPEPAGPDFRAGVPLSSLRQGEPLLGHIDGQAALLIRLESDDVHAIGATCTHYSGPLAEGVITGDTIRCPWHHACFSIRTGAATSPPALAPVPTWRTITRDGVVFVLDPLKSVVIIGAGAAGMVAAETLRNEGFDDGVYLIDPDPDAPYDRPNLSKDYLAGSAPEEWLRLRTSEFYEEKHITRLVKSAERIDDKRKAVVLSDGTEINYDALLLATGARPIRLPIPGADMPHVHVLRSFQDCQSLIAAISSKPRVVIAGASFIGLEAAASLRNRGVDVTVVAPEQLPLQRVLGDDIGRLLLGRHEKNGVHFHLGRTLKAIAAKSVTLDNDATINADVVLLGVGVKPDVALASAAGLTIDNGVVVNEFLETNVAGIFAAGDIARFPDPRTGELIRVEHWVVAERQGQAAARNILGAAQPFDSVPFFWTHQYDVTVNYVGHASKWDAAQLDGSAEALDCAVTYRDAGAVRAVATINRDKTSLNAEIVLARDEMMG